MRNWKEILPPIHDRIAECELVFNQIYHVDSSKVSLNTLILQLRTDGFQYVDPFYDEINANTDLEFITCEMDEFELSNYHQLEDFEFESREHYIYGWFSNSLDVKTDELKFGMIKDGGVETEIVFYLTNSDSYPWMTGTEKDHRTIRSTIGRNIKFDQILILDKRKFKLKGIESLMTKNELKFEDLEPIGLKTKNPWERWYVAKMAL